MAENEYKPMDARLQEWQAPPAAVNESDKVGWLNSSTEEGQAWLKSQRGYSDFRQALDTISGRDTSTLQSSAYRSTLNPNRLKRNIKEVIGALSKLRPLWGYQSDNKAYKSQADTMNKTTRAWYLESMADRKIKEALAYASATCRGWIWPVYTRAMYGTGRGNIVLKSFGAPSVLPNQLPASGDWQSAYVVHILEEMPVAMAHGMFPAFQSRLQPSRSKYWYANDGVRKAAVGNWIQRAFGRKREGASTELSELLVPVRYSYVIDLTINTTKAEIPMGEPGTSWFYNVPYIGQTIPTGVDPSTGQPTSRIADENDARLYPYRRLLISSDQCVMYDGPAFDWHGMLPLASFCLDEWPWEPIGFSLVHDGFSINESLKELYRGNMDKARAQLNPAITYDTNSVARAEALRFDPLMPKGRYGYDGSASDGEPFKPAVPLESLKIWPESLDFTKILEGALDSQMAINDVQALVASRAAGAMDDLEKIMERNGPIIEDMSRSMEPPMRDIGTMIKYLILQYYTTPRVMQYVGPDGISWETFDYDPTSLIPSHMPGESVDGPSPTSRIQRARTLADNLRFMIMPSSLHELTQMGQKLGLIQLRKAGIMIDSQTIADAWNVPNYGTIDGATVLDRWRQEQEETIMLAARAKVIAEALGLNPPAAAGGGPGGPSGPAPPGQPPPGAPGPGGTAPEGRPSSFTAAPALAQKDGGSRSTITTSK